uniref:Putative carbon storage regulator n=1 Tax=viral metagenome TaxID=1070528 RepID=A0A6M3K8P3_9ZZZZ
MLLLARKRLETIRIGDAITVTVTRLSRGHVTLAVDAPRDVPLYREEVYQRILAAAETGNPPLHVVEDELDAADG